MIVILFALMSFSHCFPECAIGFAHLHSYPPHSSTQVPPFLHRSGLQEGRQPVSILASLKTNYWFQSLMFKNYWICNKLKIWQLITKFILSMNVFVQVDHFIIEDQSSKTSNKSSSNIRIGQQIFRRSPYIKRTFKTWKFIVIFQID